jgi:tetratricopeptide (TPR) repeat protein
METVQALLDASHACRYGDVQRGYELAELASLIAAYMGPDARALALCCLSNASRLLSRFDQAKNALCEAERLLAVCSRTTRARYLEVRSTLFSTLRDYPAACAAAWEAVRLREAEGVAPNVARALIKAGIYEGYAGRPAAAVRTLTRAMGLIPPGARRLGLSSLQALAWNLLECGCSDRARAVVAKAYRILSVDREPLMALKLTWLTGRISLSSGDLVTAQHELQQAEEGFLAREMLYEAALVGIELSEVQVAAGRASHFRDKVRELRSLFNALGITSDHQALTALETALAGASSPRSALREAAEALRSLPLVA